MNRFSASLFVCFGSLLFAGSAFAQTAPDQSQMYEDIEIMGRILDRVLSLPRHSNTLVAVSVPQSSGLINTVVPFDPVGPNGSDVNLNLLSVPQYNIWYPEGVRLRTTYAPNLTTLYNQQAHTISVPVLSYPKTQGTYVKDQGVIFTVILPPPSQDPRPRTVAAAPKGPTEWERVRQQLHGEKAATSPSKPQAKEPSVADLVLEALAKNGHHFTELAAKESLIVSIVFRPEEQQGDGGQASGPTDSGQNAATSGGQQGNSAANSSEKKNQDSNVSTQSAEPTTPKDYELLGDLHLKQGQSKEALKAYQKAAEKNPDPQHAAAMYLKMAQIYLTAENNKAEAEKALDKARNILPKATPKKETPQVKKAKSPLPSRMIVTISKNLLDLAGNGHISLEEFKKGATVEYLPFAAAKGPGQE